MAAWVLDISFNFYSVKNHEIDNNLKPLKVESKYALIKNP